MFTWRSTTPPLCPPPRSKPYCSDRGLSDTRKSLCYTLCKKNAFLKMQVFHNPCLSRIIQHTFIEECKDLVLIWRNMYVGPFKKCIRLWDLMICTAHWNLIFVHNLIVALLLIFAEHPCPPHASRRRRSPVGRHCRRRRGRRCSCRRGRRRRRVRPLDGCPKMSWCWQTPFYDYP